MAADPKMRFLVVDDFSTMRRIVRNLLKELGFTNVDEAEDGAIALQKLQGGGFEFVPAFTGPDGPEQRVLLRAHRGNLRIPGAARARDRLGLAAHHLLTRRHRALQQHDVAAPCVKDPSMRSF